MHEESTGLPASQQGAYAWCDVLAKSVLFLFGIALWHKGLSLYVVSYALPLIWVLDGGLRRFRYGIKEPLVVAILVFCIALALGILWSDNPKLGFKVWQRYWAFLFFIPYLALLNKKRLPWAIGGLLAGFLMVLLVGLYQWIVMQQQGVPLLKLSHTSYSLMLGIGTILSLYFAGTSNDKKIRAFLWLLMFCLLFIQFNQGSRTALLATIFTIVLLIFMLYKKETKTLLVVMAALISVAGVFAYSSNMLKERLIHAQSDIESSQQGKYATSLGYRLAMWDVGLHSIAQRPLFGYGTGMVASHFDETVETYKRGIYKDLPDKFVKTYHYHNDLIEIAVNIGILGLAAYAWLLLSWLKTLRAHRLGILGAAFVCYVFLAGLTETLVFFRQTLYLLLAITAVCIVWKEAESGNNSLTYPRHQLPEGRSSS